jgi:mRNA-degrading endonuclease RelE of RelBE toxin-antitoxin system
MKFEVSTTSTFRREAKKMLKKYPSLRQELLELNDKLSSNPTLGVKLGNNCLKIRMSIASKGKGKSGGARIITHFYIEGSTVYLLSIFDKSETDSISDSQIADLIKLIRE